MSGTRRQTSAAQHVIKLSRLIETEAAELRKPQRPELLTQHLDRIAHAIGALRVHTVRANMPKPEQISQQVAKDLEAVLGSLQEVLPQVLEGRPYALFVFTEGLTNYASNAERDDVVSALRDFVAAHDVSPPEDAPPAPGAA